MFILGYTNTENLSYCLKLFSLTYLLNAWFGSHCGSKILSLPCMNENERDTRSLVHLCSNVMFLFCSTVMMSGSCLIMRGCIIGKPQEYINIVQR